LGIEISPLLEEASGSVEASLLGAGFNLGGCVSWGVEDWAAGAPAALGAMGLGFACGGDIVGGAASLVGFAGASPAGFACTSLGLAISPAASFVWFSAKEGISAASAAFAFANWDVLSEVSEESSCVTRGGAFFAAPEGGGAVLPLSLAITRQKFFFWEGDAFFFFLFLFFLSIFLLLFFLFLFFFFCFHSRRDKVPMRASFR
jgi:hypothetical protein